MARVSFGSRAGSYSDYLVGGSGADHALRTSNLNGVYNTLTELANALKQEIAACRSNELPQLTTCELSIRDEGSLPLLRPAIGPYSDGGEHDLPAEYKSGWMDGTEAYPGIDVTLPKTTIAHILASEEGQARQIVQRAASRAIVQAIEAMDGFKYSFNNAWAAKDDGGLRYSYICQDSMQNKDRHANGFTKTQKHLKGEGERGPRKPTYDCKGSISVKFSAVRKTVDIYYRHNAIHSSVADRKPRPRAMSRPKERPSTDGLPVPLRQERDTGGLLGTLRAEEAAYFKPAPMPPPSRTQVSNISRPLKRKRDPSSDVAGNDPTRPMSLVDLLKQSEDAKIPAKRDASAKPSASYNPPPIEYSLPSWQAPPSPPPPPVPAFAQQQNNGYQSTWNGSSYAPPYQPQKYPQQQQPAYLQTAAMSTSRNPTLAPSGHRYQGTPSKVNVPTGHGLFSTLKPVRKEAHTTYEPHFVIYSGNRAKTSCQHCRLSKKKCDEGRPKCGACARSGKLDCDYELRAPTGATHFVPAPSPGPSSMHQSPSQQSTSHSQTMFHPQSAYPSQSSYHSAPSQQRSAPSTNPYATSQTTMSSQTLSGNEGSSQFQSAYAHSQPQYGGAMMQKEESPDPWFPRR